MSCDPATYAQPKQMSRPVKKVLDVGSQVWQTVPINQTAPREIEMIHLATTREGNACGVDGDSTTDINFVLCQDCFEAHEVATNGITDHDQALIDNEPCCYGYVTSRGNDHEIDCFTLTGTHKTSFPSYE